MSVSSLEFKKNKAITRSRGKSLKVAKIYNTFKITDTQRAQCGFVVTWYRVQFSESERQSFLSIDSAVSSLCVD